MAHRYRGNGSKTGTKEILQVVLIRQFGLCSPAIYIITHPIAVLHFRKTKSIINGQAGRERYFMNSGLAPFFSGYQYYPISSLATIQSCSRSTSSGFRLEMPSPPSRLPALAVPPIAE